MITTDKNMNRFPCSINSTENNLYLLETHFLETTFEIFQKKKFFENCEEMSVYAVPTEKAFNITCIASGLVA